MVMATAVTLKVSGTDTMPDRERDRAMAMVTATMG